MRGSFPSVPFVTRRLGFDCCLGGRHGTLQPVGCGDAAEQLLAVGAGKNRVGGPEGGSFFSTLIVQ